MKSKQLTINGVDIIAHSDGSITKPFHKRNKRTFGCKNNLGYMQIVIGGKTFKMHRINAQAFLPDFSTLPQVDHIDNVKWNNNITNLRMTTNQLNQQSKKRKTKGCSSQFRGVSWNKKRKKWEAYCTIDNNKKRLGFFDSEFDAAIARDAYWFSQGLPIEGLNFPEKYTKCA